MPPTERPLAGRRILVTREPARCVTVTARLEKLGARVDACAAIAFEAPRNEGAAAAAVAGLARYDWLVFSSPIGARFFGARLQAAGAPTPPLALRVVAIGPATAKALAALGLQPELTVAQSHGEGLAQALAPRVRPGERVLVVRPEEALPTVPDALRGAGAEVDTVAFYRTVAAPEAALVTRRIAQRTYDAVVVTSPSNWRHIASGGAAEGAAWVEGVARARRIAIGPTTAAAMSDAGAPAHAVAAVPDDDGLVAAVLRAFGA
jgi:uroporphyrinogen-III synthase